MSLYIGNNGSEKVLHIYDGSSNIEKNIINGTSFHSSLPYYTLNSIHRFVPSGTPYVVASGNVWGEKQNYVISTGSIPSGDFSTIIRGSYQGTIYTFPTSAGEGYFSGLQAIYAGNPLANCPAFRLDSLTSGFTARAQYAPNNIVLFSIATFDYIDVYLFNELITPMPSLDIRISNDNILINGVSILSKIYAHFMTSIDDRANDYDTIIPIPRGGTYRALTYATSTNNLSHASNGEYALIQLINSYPYSATAVNVTSAPSSIAVIRNNINMPLFKDNIKFKSSISALPQFRILSYGQSMYGGATTLLSTMYFNSTFQNGTLLFNILVSKSGFATIKDILCIVPIIAGRRVTIITSYYWYIFGEISASANSINFYVYSGVNNSFITNIDVNVYTLS